jgi:predicted Ser/Thr protein kinase
MAPESQIPAAARFCPTCGTQLTGNVCPKCVLRLGMETQTAPAGWPRFTPPSPQSLTGRLPGLEILELLGQGGMGAVYKGRQTALDRLVAIKILPAANPDPAFAERFNREARALARLCHPNIVNVYDFGRTTDGDLVYFVMEYVPGVNLRQMLVAGTLAPRDALRIVPQVCEALQYAHDQGIVHRDIKPENILIDNQGRVKIADFGLAKLLAVAPTPADLTLTAENHVLGTPKYMAPEQIERPAAVDHRADIYSLGVVLYEMLTGELPLGRFAPPSQKVQVDVRLDQVVLRTLEKEPARRYQHASDVKTDLSAVPAEPTQAAPGDDTAQVHSYTLPPGAGPMLMLCAGGMILGALCMTAGLGLGAFASITLLRGGSMSGPFWGWVGAAFGCFFGGGGALAGSWNSYRQLTGRRDLMSEPRWTFFDGTLVAYGVLGLLLLAAAAATWQIANRDTRYALLLLGGMVTFQGALFVLARAAMRRAAMERQRAR